MPRLNLKDDGMEEEPLPLDSDKPISPPPTLRDVGDSGGGGRSMLLLILALVVVLGAAVFALNYFKIIRLWGKKAPAVQMSDAIPPVEGTEQTNTLDQSAANPTTPQEPAPTPTQEPAPEPTPPVEKPSVSINTSGSGNYTVQVSSWVTKAKADQEASRLNAAGFTAFVEDATVGGTTWFRVRVGRYATPTEAKEAATQLSKMSDNGAWVAKVGG